MKMINFPAHMGLKPRQYDGYDALCERLYWAYQGTRNNSVIRECETSLRTNYGSDCLDTDYSHGRNIARSYRVVEV